jgi:hypothetical protein
MASRGRLIGARLRGGAFGCASRKNQRDNDANGKRVNSHHLENAWACALGCFFEERKCGKTPSSARKQKQTHPSGPPASSVSSEQ